MAGHLYSSLDMERFVSDFWADKKLTVIGTGVAVSSTPHSAALYVLLRTKKPGSDMVTEKEPCRESFFSSLALSVSFWDRRSTGSSFLDGVILMFVAQYSVGGG